MRITGLVMFPRVGKIEHGNRNRCIADCFRTVLNRMLQLMKFQVPAEIVGGLPDCFPVNIQTDGIHAALERTETGGCFAAERIQNSQRSGSICVRRLCKGDVQHHHRKRHGRFPFILQDFGKILGQIGNRIRVQRTKQPVRCLFRHKADTAVTGKKRNLRIGKRTAIKSQEFSAAGFFPRNVTIY